MFEREFQASQASDGRDSEPALRQIILLKESGRTVGKMRSHGKSSRARRDVKEDLSQARIENGVFC
ncbi:hypothetical protein ACHAXS_003505 [Conticribra weissflogii]